MKKSPVFLLLTMLAGLASAQARIITPEITGLISADGKGSYQRVLAEAARRAGVQYTAEFYPKARAVNLFLSGGYDGIFTYTQTARDKFGKEQIIASFPIGAYRGYVFTLAGSPPVKDFKSLNGKLIGGLLGFEGTYTAIAQAGAQFNLVNDDNQNIGMLKRGRLFAFLGFLPDLYSELSTLSFDPEHPFFEAYDRLTMMNTPGNRSFVEKMSTAISAMHKDGTIARLLGSAYLPIHGEFPMDK